MRQPALLTWCFVAVGSWLLVENDDIGKAILQQYGLSSVSMALNLHSPGVDSAILLGMLA